MSDQPSADSAEHVSVMLDRCVDLLAPALQGPEPVLVDCTLGLAGHAQAFLERFPELRLVGLDRDPAAIARSEAALARFGDRASLHNVPSDQLDSVLDSLDLAHIDAVLMDLGVSSMQLDVVERGFSYARDAPLDMRMDQTSGMTAADVINEYEPARLVRILRQYGDEKFATNIVGNIVRRRESEPVTTTAELADLVRQSIPAAARRTGGNPAKRTFQALRIEVNHELEVLEATLPLAISALRVGGRIAVMSFQSLEDKIVKRELQLRSTAQVPPDLPFVPQDSLPTMRLITRGAEVASSEEIEGNARAASVRLRAAERIREGS